MNDNIHYSIQQVAEQTGLSKQVIRKWEDRYGLITPRRLANGYRAYSPTEVKTIMEVNALVQRGNTVKNAIALWRKQFGQDIQYPIQLIEALIEAGYKGDDKAITQLLNQAYKTLGFEKLLYEAIIPFLEEIGNLWCSGKWREFQEAVASQTVRDFLVNIRRTIDITPDAPLVLGSCLPGEHHEIPMHILLVQFMLKGYRTLMLGQSPAPTAIRDTVVLTNPKMVLLSASTDIPFTKNPDLLKSVDDLASQFPHITFCIGGNGCAKALAQYTLQHVYFTENFTDALKAGAIQ